MNFKVGDKVNFGRPNGEQTTGIVEKVNRKSLKVRTLEARGRRAQAGQIWRVHPALCTLVERDGARVEATEATKNDGPSLAARALAKLSAEEIGALSTFFREGYRKV